MIKNYMEIAVDNVLDDILKDHELKCGCETCIMDIKAIALNNLKPKYVVSNKGILYTKLDALNTQFKTDIIFQLMDAIKMVEKNASH